MLKCEGGTSECHVILFLAVCAQQNPFWRENKRISTFKLDSPKSRFIPPVQLRVTFELCHFSDCEADGCKYTVDKRRILRLLEIRFQAFKVELFMEETFYQVWSLVPKIEFQPKQNTLLP